MAIRQEERDGALVVGGGVADHQAPERPQFGYKRLGRHQEPDAQARRQRL